MSITRRSFIGALIASAAAPAIIRAESLMPIYVPQLVLYGDGIHDDHDALQGLMDGRRVQDKSGSVYADKDTGLFRVYGGRFLIGGTLILSNAWNVSSFENCRFISKQYHEFNEGQGLTGFRYTLEQSK